MNFIVWNQILWAIPLQFTIISEILRNARNHQNMKTSLNLWAVRVTTIIIKKKMQQIYLDIYQLTTITTSITIHSHPICSRINFKDWELAMWQWWRWLIQKQIERILVSISNVLHVSAHISTMQILLYSKFVNSLSLLSSQDILIKLKSIVSS